MHYAFIMLENMLLNDFFDTMYYCQNKCLNFGHGKLGKVRKRSWKAMGF